MGAVRTEGRRETRAFSVCSVGGRKIGSADRRCRHQRGDVVMALLVLRCVRVVLGTAGGGHGCLLGEVHRAEIFFVRVEIADT